MSETVKFTQDIMNTARDKAQQIIGQAEDERQRLLEEARNVLGREVAEIRTNAEAEAEGIKRRAVSEVRHRVKMREQLEKDKILTDVLEEAKKKVLEITKDYSKYFSYLVNLISEGIRQLGLDSVTIHMNAEDLKRIDPVELGREVNKGLQAPTKVEVSRHAIPSSGGVIISNSDGKIRIVNTLEQRFAAMEPKLLIEAGHLLFSEHNPPK